MKIDYDEEYEILRVNMDYEEVKSWGTIHIKER